MGTFLDWAKESGYDFSFLADVQPGEKNTDAEESKPTTDENRARTGYSANYPPAYFSSQYPHKYVNPKKATADLDAEIMGKNKSK